MRHDAQPTKQVTIREREQSQLIFGHVRPVLFIVSAILDFFFLPLFFGPKKNEVTEHFRGAQKNFFLSSTIMKLSSKHISNTYSVTLNMKQMNILQII